MRNFSISLALVLTLVPCAFSQGTFGSNLIVNGDAEAGSGVGSNIIVGSIPGWTSSGANVITYASGFGITISDLVPVGAGKNYFSNGSTASNMTQTINLSFAAATVDAGSATFDASGYFGGYADYDDNATMTVVFLNASGTSLSSVSVGGVKSADRTGTGMYLRRQIGIVPAGARSAKVTLSYVFTGGNNNAGADNLSLILKSPASSPTIFGSNVIVNGDAEKSVQLLYDLATVADIPSWVRSASFAANLYGESSSDLGLTDPAPPDRGKSYFYGGSSNPASSGYQDIDLSQGAAQIDGGGVKFNLGAWLGGYSSQNDNAVLTVQFMTWSGTVLSSVKLGPVLSGERNNNSGLIQKSASGTIPAGTRMAHIQLDMTRTDGSDNDGMADSLTLILTNSGAVPAISANGVITAAAFGGSKTIAPGTWIEIYGQNLAPDAREWAGGDFAGSTAPNSLDGVKVSIGGQPAYVRYISAGQVNVQVPSSVGNGQQQLVLTTGGGSSAPYPVTVSSTQAAVLAPSTFIVGGKQYVAALFANGSTFAIPPATLTGVDSRQAKPGETIIVYGIGFGPTNPNINAGQITSVTNTLSSPVQVTFGTTPATLNYQGLSPSFVGLYQFNIVVPNVANNDFVPITFTQGGSAIGQTLFTAVHN